MSYVSDKKMMYVIETRSVNWKPEFNTNEWLPVYHDYPEKAEFDTFTEAIAFMIGAEKRVPWANYRINRR